jgi:hypothetical protein
MWKMHDSERSFVTGHAMWWSLYRLREGGRKRAERDISNEHIVGELSLHFSSKKPVSVLEFTCGPAGPVYQLFDAHIAGIVYTRLRWRGFEKSGNASTRVVLQEWICEVLATGGPKPGEPSQHLARGFVQQLKR